MRKILKITGVSLSLLFIILLCGGLFALWKMPSAGDLGRSILQPKKSTAIEPTKVTDKQSPATLKEPDMVSDKEETVSQQNEKSNVQVLNQLMDPSQPKSQVCSQLSNIQLLPPGLKYDLETLSHHIEDALTSENQPKDPVVLAMLAPIKLFFQQPKMQLLVRSVNQAAKKDEESSLIEKADFYKQIFGAYEEMKNQQSSAEALMDRGYYLVMMVKAIQRNPSLSSDPRLLDYCQSIEKAANEGIPSNSQIEKSEFQNFLDYVQVKPSEIGYDPNYKTHLEFQKSLDGIRINGGWVDSLLKPSDKEPTSSVQ